MKVQRGFNRADRVKSLILQILAQHLSTRLVDKRLKNLLFTDVEMTRDLKIAKVYFRFVAGVPEEDGIKEAREALDSAKPQFRHELNRQMVIKYVPELRFYYDEGLDKRARIEDLLSDITYSTPSDETSTPE